MQKGVKKSSEQYPLFQGNRIRFFLWKTAFNSKWWAYENTYPQEKPKPVTWEKRVR